MSKAAAGARAYPHIRFGSGGGEVAELAARDLSRGLSAMTGGEVPAELDASIRSAAIHIELESPDASPEDRTTSTGDSFEVSRTARSIVLRAGSARGLLHGGAAILEKLGARFIPGVAPLYPRLELSRLGALAPFSVTPAFARRAFVSDIMTWNYMFADRLAQHLQHDREFIPWMARRGINAFSYIRHAHDTRLKIDEIAPMLREHGIDAEYGGHVLQVLLPRERFATNPDYFPADDDGNRAPRGNLCVSNPDALALVREGALACVREHPENQLLHIWGADVRRGAWCRCAACRDLPPQLQYMKVVNAIAATLAEDPKAPPVAYLAYHDTIEPHPGLRPLANVWFEWAPRERCYSHALDDTACEINPHYLETLKRYLEIFDGRAHVFEYYADAILFGGVGFATPAVVARDLRAYRALGISSISCLTFGAYSVMSYPVNLEAFVRGSRDAGFDADSTLSEVAAGRHPACAPEMTAAYRAVARASKLALDYADVMSPAMPAEKAARKRFELNEAAEAFQQAIVAAERISRTNPHPLANAERELWRYSSEALRGIAQYLAARVESGHDRQRLGEAAIARIAGSVDRIRAIDLATKGTWGAYDLEWLREMWLNGLRRGLEDAPPLEEML